VTPAEPLPSARRKALWALAIGLLGLALGWLAREGGWLPPQALGFLFGLGAGGLVAALLLWWTPDFSEGMPRPLMRRYYREFGLAMGGYVLVMLFWKRLLYLFEPTWWRVAVALLPVLFVCLVLRAFVRFVRDSDEMQRRIELESGAIAALLVSALYLGAGFLHSAKLIFVPASLALIGVFPAQCLVYGVTKIFVARRYL
jgi:hypothetical protein